MTGEKVALKIMPRSRKHPEVEQVYESEVQFLKNAEHPNIVQLYAWSDQMKALDRNNKTLPVYTVEMEFAPHGELFDFVQTTGRFSEKEARFYFHQLIDALEYIHSKGYAHRDIKMENLFLDDQYNLKLGDFGFCTSKEKCQQIVGTTSYMMPEILKGEEYDTKAADLFAAAIVLFTMMTGHPPFAKADLRDRNYRKLVLGDVKSFWQLHESKIDSKNGFNSEFKELFTKMVDVDTSKRLSLLDIKTNEWFNGPVVTLDDIKDTFQLRFKILKSQQSEPEHVLGHSLGKYLQIPNDAELCPPKRKLGGKGLQVKKYSEEFTTLSAEHLKTQIKEFWAQNDIVVQETDNCLELVSEHPDRYFRIKASVIVNPVSNLPCVEFIKLEGTKLDFTEAYIKICEVLTDAEDKY